jgi:alpha-beta hydrolase superfamily lysophospholipase
MRRLLAAALALAAFAFVATGGAIASVFMAARPALNDDHRALLRNPAHAGLRVQALDCFQGEVPCLVVSPVPGAQPGRRGGQLRRQLLARRVAPLPEDEVAGTLVLLHGRNSRKEHLLRIAERFAAAGFRFGTTEFERQLPARALQSVQRQLGWAPAPAFLWGYSMGGAVALNAAAEADAPWRGIIIVSSFDRLDAVVDEHLNRHLGQLAALHADWFSPVGAWLGTPPVTSVQPSHIAPRVHIPAMVIHGDRDATIDPARGRALFAALGATDKQWITVPGAGHGDVFVTDMPLFARMTEWMLVRRAEPPDEARACREGALRQRQPLTCIK